MSRPVPVDGACPYPPYGGALKEHARRSAVRAGGAQLQARTRHTGRRPAPPGGGGSLSEDAPARDAAQFFQPFRDMVDRDFDIPDTLPDAIEREWIPLMYSAIGSLRPSAVIDTARTTQDPYSVRARAWYMPCCSMKWRALCVPPLRLPWGLLRNGQLSVARLAARLGLDVDDGPDTSLAIRFGHHRREQGLAEQRGHRCDPRSEDLARSGAPARTAGAGVPAEHIADLLSMARWADWDVAESRGKLGDRTLYGRGPEPALTVGIRIPNGWASGSWTPADFHARMKALHELSRTRLDALRVETAPAMESLSAADAVRAAGGCVDGRGAIGRRRIASQPLCAGSSCPSPSA